MIIGIDLGTSTSEASAMINGEPVVLKNTENSKITPSYVGIDDNGSFIAGQNAAAQYLLKPDKITCEIKRLFGTKKPVTLDGVQYSPVDLSAELLRYIKSYSEAALGEKIDTAVITVPAYFNDLQRRQTVEAGVKAGFTVKRIINEPTAAALCYGLDHIGDESNVLVYDLGGGTFDVTVLEMFDGVLDVKASGGINQLGGKDFDARIIDWLINKFQAENGVNLRDIPYAMVKLKSAAEACKIALSSSDEYELNIPFITKSDNRYLSIHEVLNVSWFENLINDLIVKTGEQTEATLRDAGLKADEIDTVLLVGGSTRIPAVKRYVEKLLGKAAGELVDPDLAVAMGAAIQAGIIEDKDGSNPSGMVISDVCSFGLGLRVINDDDLINTDIMATVIPKNTTIPTTRQRVFYTAVDNQSRALLDIYQGNSEKASENRNLGSFILSGIPKGAAGTESLLVSFSYDINAILNVEGIISSTGEKASIDIDMNSVCDSVCDADDNNEAADDGEHQDLSGWVNSPKAKKYRWLINKFEKLIAEGTLDEDDEQFAANSLKNIKKNLIGEKTLIPLEAIEATMLIFLEGLKK